MLSALLFTVVSAQGLSGPVAALVDRVEELPDAAVQSLAISYYRDIRRLVVADDGFGIYRTPSSSMVEGEGVVGMGAYATPRRDKPAELEWTMMHSPQTWYLTLEKGFELDPAWDYRNQELPRAEVAQVVAARPGGRLVLSYGKGRGKDLVYGEAGVLELPIQAKTSPLKTVASFKDHKYLLHVVADLASDSYWVNDRLVGEKTMSVAERGQGFAAFSLDSSRDVILGYTFGENGGPIDLATRPLGEKKYTFLRKDSESGGGWSCAMLLHNGNVLASRKDKLVIWEGKDWRELGPYMLQGSSANGRWAVLSHATERKSWLVRFK